MSSRKRTSQIREDGDGALWVEAAAVANPAIILYAGLPWSILDPPDGPAYLRIDDAIDWCRKERARQQLAGFDRVAHLLTVRIDVLERAKVETAGRREAAKPA